MTRAALACLTLMALLALPAVDRSGADFTASAPSPENAFAAAADFNTVTVAITDPGTPLRGTVALQASAFSERGIAVVRFESSPAGAGAWSAACEATSAPYRCDWDTAAVADNRHDVRAVAVDEAGYERIAELAARLVDNGAPTVSLADPGPWLQGTEVLTTTGVDPHSGLATLAIEYRPVSDGSWTELCESAVSPRSCALQTTGLADGDYELRARAVDAAGNARATAPLTRRVDNTAPTVAITDPGAMRGMVTLAASTDDGAGTGVAGVRYEYRVGGGPWTEACTGSFAPFACSWDTTAQPDGVYELRAIASDATGLAGTSPALADRRIDNTPPRAPTLDDPGALLRGSVTLSGTAADGGAGIAGWTVQHRPAGSGAWSDACSDAAAPYTCDWNTAGVADGLYDLRAVARDSAGNETGSAVLASRRIDNNGPAVSLDDPGSLLRATVTLTAAASDPAGVKSVVFERRPAAGGSWTAMCTDTAAPYTCAFNTTGVADGSYDLRARAIDTAGHASVAVVAARQLDNTRPTGTDVQAGNGGATPGRLEPGDWLQLTWTEPIAPASVLAGWDGTAQAITIKVQNTGGNDRLDFSDATGQTRLNLTANSTGFRLGRNFVSTNAQFDATMLQNGASITITLGTRRSGTLTSATAGALTWTPSASATDHAGNPSATTPVTEPGASDTDF